MADQPDTRWIEQMILAEDRVTESAKNMFKNLFAELYATAQAFRQNRIQFTIPGPNGRKALTLKDIGSGSTKTIELILTLDTKRAFVSAVTYGGTPEQEVGQRTKSPDVFFIKYVIQDNKTFWCDQNNQTVDTHEICRCFLRPFLFLNHEFLYE